MVKYKSYKGMSFLKYVEREAIRLAEENRMQASRLETLKVHIISEMKRAHPKQYAKENMHG